MQPVLDTRRITTFLLFAFGIAWATGLVIYLTGGLVNSPTLIKTPILTLNLATLLMATTYMFAPALAVVATRLVTREGWGSGWPCRDQRHRRPARPLRARRAQPPAWPLAYWADRLFGLFRGGVVGVFSGASGCHTSQFAGGASDLSAIGGCISHFGSCYAEWDSLPGSQTVDHQ